jgi:hypothetical protein
MPAEKIAYGLLIIFVEFLAACIYNRNICAARRQKSAGGLRRIPQKSGYAVQCDYGG